jgi:hypothetical protein
MMCLRRSYVTLAGHFGSGGSGATGSQGRLAAILYFSDIAEL